MLYFKDKGWTRESPLDNSYWDCMALFLKESHISSLKDRFYILLQIAKSNKADCILTAKSCLEDNTCLVSIPYSLKKRGNTPQDK